MADSADSAEAYAEKEPLVRMIPGSEEQRGTDFRKAMRGHVPFCRRVIDFFLFLATGIFIANIDSCLITCSCI